MVDRTKVVGLIEELIDRKIEELKESLVDEPGIDVGGPRDSIWDIKENLRRALGGEE